MISIRLLNLATGICMLIFVGITAHFAWAWMGNRPFFALRSVYVEGDLAHVNDWMVRTQVLPELKGNFLTADLNAIKHLFEQLSWVRTAEVHRTFPNRLHVKLTEHETAAYWGSEDDNQLVNTFGEVFEANTGEVDAEFLPRLQGDPKNSKSILALETSAQTLLGPLSLRIERLEVLPHGSVNVDLDSGAHLALGSGESNEVLARLGRFARTFNQVKTPYGPARAEQLLLADLRYPQGYALRFRGVNTVSNSSSLGTNNGKRL